MHRLSINSAKYERIVEGGRNEEFHISSMLLGIGVGVDGFHWNLIQETIVMLYASVAEG